MPRPAVGRLLRSRRLHRVPARKSGCRRRAMNHVSPRATEPTRAEHAERMAAYLRAGEERARALANRGPVQFGADGRLHPDILEAYWRHGFYVFEGVVGEAELEELRADADTMIARAPVSSRRRSGRAGPARARQGLCPRSLHAGQAALRPLGRDRTSSTAAIRTGWTQPRKRTADAHRTMWSS